MAIEAAVDAGPLIALARIDRLDLLGKVLRPCHVTESVLAECVGRPEAPGAATIREALGEVLTACVDPAPVSLPSPLGPGERSVLALALERGISALLDERTARRVAIHRGISVIGTGAILVRAKEMGEIESVRPLLDDLHGIGYRISPKVRADILRVAGED